MSNSTVLAETSAENLSWSELIRSSGSRPSWRWTASRAYWQVRNSPPAITR